MGFLNFLKYSRYEKALLEKYILEIAVMGLEPSRAMKMAKNMLDTSMSESKKDGSYYLPNNFGDIVLGEEKSGYPDVNKLAEVVRKRLPIYESEGVTKEDLKFWWNRPELSRRMALKTDEIRKYNFYYGLIAKSADGKLTEKEQQDCLKGFPVYGYPAAAISEDEDRRLPSELLFRVDQYIKKRSEDPESFNKEKSESSSFNALVRKAVRAGEL
ncbi:MAG TPA: hypothetical protein VGK71_03170 [Nitrospirota bacterium]|jgi:hypothetical protein